MVKERGKRCYVFSLIFAIITFLPFYFNGKFVNAASVPTDGTRYTVLAIDLSGSMSGTPLDAAKESAKKFCAAMMSSEGKNYISIIFYKSSAQIECEFTDDLDKINTTIDGFSASGGTNMNEALLNAKSIIDQLPSSSTKNVVLLSDGLPEQGKCSQEGPYSALDHSSYEYGNAVYNTAVALQGICNIYTLGFFHSSNGNDRSFGQKLLKDIQNKGYYDVQDPDDLEFVFGELADTITDSTMKKLWVQQHKQYVESDQYRKDIINGYNDYLYDIAKYDVGNTKVTAYNTLNTMKKFLGIFIVLLLVAGGIFVYYRFFFVFGEGVKSGELNYVVYKGVVFKTYEGKLIQSGIRSKTAGSVQSYEFEFSVDDEELARELMLQSGKTLELHYKEYFGALPWRGFTKFIVDSIIVKPQPEPLIPEAAE